MTREHEYGQLEVDGDRAVVRFTRQLAQPPGAVWRALTEDEHLAAWFPTTIEGERRAGAALTFHHRGIELPPMEGEMRAFEPPSLMELTWGGDVLRFELAPEGDGTRLALTVQMEELGKASRDGAGWHVCLDRLAQRLGGQPAPGDDWRDVNRAYVARFGPEASTLGPPPPMTSGTREG